MTKQKNLSTDVLIIGGGSAGCMAAIAAKERNPKADVLVLEKGDIRRSGSIAMGMDGLNIVAQPGKETPELYVEASSMACEDILDHKPSHVMAEKSYAMLRKLEGWGVNFPRDKEGKYISLQVHPKGKFLVEMNEPDLKVMLAEKVKESGARVLNRTMATSLIVSDESPTVGAIAGATGVNIATGEFVCCSAKTVILANGGCARFGLPNSGYLYGTFDFPGNAGDGYSMAFRAGAQLTGLEYTMCMPLIKDINCPLLYITLTRGAQVVNALGDRIDIGGLSAKGMLKEIYEGRGPVFVKMNHLDEERIQAIENILFSTERPMQKRFWEGRGMDFRRDMIELHPTEFYLCGGHGLTGLVVDEYARTNVEGLYAVGDVACVPRQHLTGAFVFGAIAGAHAVEKSATIQQNGVDGELVSEERRRIFGGLDAGRKTGGADELITVADFEYKVRRTINDYVTPPKNEYKLRQAVKWMDRFKDELNNVKARDCHELGRLLEVSCIVDCARLSAIASLERKESRWGCYHYRSDYPEKDDENWRKHVVIDKNGVSFREIGG